MGGLVNTDPSTLPPGSEKESSAALVELPNTPGMSLVTASVMAMTATSPPAST
jgi:hypothetical protein